MLSYLLVYGYSVEDKGVIPSFTSMFGIVCLQLYCSSDTLSDHHREFNTVIICIILWRQFGPLLNYFDMGIYSERNTMLHAQELPITWGRNLYSTMASQF